VTKPVAFSFSRLDSYETCPKKYWAISVGKTVRDEGNEHTHYGEEVHKAFANYFKGKPLPLHLRHLEPALLPIRSAPGVKIIEQKLAINAEYEGCDWFAKDTYCRVISDLTILNGTKAVLFDWKTGKMKDDFLQLRLAGAVILLLAPEIESAQLVYYWTKNKKFTRDKNDDGSLKLLTRDDIPKVFDSLAPRLQRYQDAHAREEFPARPSYICRYCPVLTCQHNEVKR
jgi:CRISPR/Cas system-associated exonuclease Cas4 (RecB family)